MAKTADWACPACIQVPVVVGIGSCQVPVNCQVSLAGNAIEIDHIQKSVEILPAASKVIDGEVIIDGILHKDVVYKKKVNQTACGPLRYCLVDTPFHCLVTVPYARKGDDLQVESVGVVGELNRLDPPTCRDPGRTPLREKDVVRLVVLVTRTRQMTVQTLHPGVCPSYPDGARQGLP